jgi:hypothetical protein
MDRENNGKNTKIVWIVLAVILGIIIICGLIAGIVYFHNNNSLSGKNSSSQIAEIQDLTTYVNARYGFSFNHPKSFTKTESQNNDGVTLTSDDPQTTIRAYGSQNALSQNLNEYLNESKDNLSKEHGNVEEILSEQLTIGGIPAQERQWKYTNSTTGAVVFVDQVTALKDSVFYTVQMVVDLADNNEYPAHVFDEILNSFKFSQ